MADSNYDALTLEELEAEFKRLAIIERQVRDDRKAILTLMERRRADVRAAERVSRLTDLERDALRAELDR